MSASKKANKGAFAEEALRHYFLSLGFFVSRGVKFRFQDFEITDIDLWLYHKETTLTRDIINVDIKNKRTPQAIERIFWSKGLQEILGLTRCIVATTDKRPATRDFGEMHGVTILDGNFLNRLTTNYTNAHGKLSEEEVNKILDTPLYSNSAVKWLSVYDKCKINLVNNLNYNGANIYLNIIHDSIEDYLLSSKKAEAPLRVLYFSLSYLMLCIDYKGRLFSSLTSDERKTRLVDGFRYGESGRQRANEILKTAVALAEQATAGKLFAQNILQKEIEKELSAYPAEGLASYFSKPEVLKSLFDTAKQFHSLALSKDLQSPDAIEANLKAYIGLVVDHFEIDRKGII